MFDYMWPHMQVDHVTHDIDILLDSTPNTCCSCRKQVPMHMDAPNKYLTLYGSVLELLDSLTHTSWLCGCSVSRPSTDLEASRASSPVLSAHPLALCHSTAVDGVFGA